MLGSDDNRRGFQPGSRPQLTHVEGTDFQKSRAFFPAGVTQAGKIVWLPGQTAVTELADCCPPCLLESFLRLSLVSCPISLFPATSISSVRKPAIVLSTSKSMPRAVTRQPRKTSSRPTKSMTSYSPFGRNFHGCLRQRLEAGGKLQTHRFDCALAQSKSTALPGAAERGEYREDTGAEGKCQRIRPPESWRPKLGALLRADMCHGVAPLPLLADCSGSTGSRTAKASRSRLLALGAGRHHRLVRMGRVSQSNRHDNCKQRYSESLQHNFFLPLR